MAVGLGGLGCNVLDQRLAEAVRRHGQLAVVGLAAVAGERVEQCGHVGCKVPVGSEQAEVLVDASRVGVEVAGADEAVVGDSPGLTPHHHRQLAVGLQTHDAVGHMHARALQDACPLDVGVLVEAGLQLDDHHDLLAALGSPDERIDESSPLRGPVHGQLDGEHVWIVGGLANERVETGRERLVGQVHQDVLALEDIEEVDAGLGLLYGSPPVPGTTGEQCTGLGGCPQRQRRPRAVGRCLEIVAVDAVELEQI